MERDRQSGSLDPRRAPRVGGFLERVKKRATDSYWHCPPADGPH